MSKKWTRARRLKAVEAAIRERGWSWHIASEIAEESGYSLRTIYRDRDDVLRSLSSEEAPDYETRLTRWLVDLRRLRGKAEESLEFPAAARLLAMEGKALGLESPPLPEVPEVEGELDVSLEGVLKVVRRMRIRAELGNSYIAAGKLLTQEQELVLAIRKRDETVAAEQLEHLTPEAVLDLVVQALEKLPAELREAVIQGVRSGG